MNGKIVLTARDRPRRLWGRWVEYCLTWEGDSRRILLKKSISVPRMSPLNAYAGKFVRIGLARSQEMGVPFEDRTWLDAEAGSIG
ncbi:MAG: hypothetical protein AB7F50_01440 [Fimbriimonadaceae bacterium]